MKIYDCDLEYETVWLHNELYTYCTYKTTHQIKLTLQTKERLIEWYKEIFYPYTQMREDRLFRITK